MNWDVKVISIFMLCSDFLLLFSMTGKNAFSLAVYSVDCVICGKIKKLKRKTSTIGTFEYQRK